MSDIHDADMLKTSSAEATHASDLTYSTTSDNAEFERRAVRKLDLTVLPLVTLFYLLSFLDRANIGNAKIAGLTKDLGLTTYQYEICVTALYVPYIASELPANLLLRKIGPKVLLPTLLTTWGIILMLQGFVTSFGGLVATRFFLGLVEGPMFPGIVLYLSGFYTRKELSMRVALFFSAASLSGAFSGLLAAGIENMDGLGGKPGWAWIFILEGLFSFLVGILSFFVIASTPRDSKFLSAAQKDVIMRRLEKDRPSLATHDHFSGKEILRSMTSPHVLIVFVMFFMNGCTLFGLALFLPTIVNTFGFSTTKTQLLSVGPFATGFIVTLISAYLSDRYRTRTVPVVILAAIAVAGYAMYLTSEGTWVAYGSLFITVSGIYGLAPILSAWMANNSEPYYRRASSIAFGFIATNAASCLALAGGILSTWRFPASEAPKFRKTTIMNLIFAALILVGALVNAVVLSHMNKQKTRKREEILAQYSDDTEFDANDKAWADLGDRHPDFRYAL
ncbi:MFS general substrate transporter [Athelia psychrophila]|uniref:MFS general substrate transporter n=1 Tax=Athelia psychrophila TaxID=1759441 RepID=A0A165WPR9_9AGAM|nr:MFS general substrate transporter [Fibularhizoctonia sp. CBS 109695]